MSNVIAEYSLEQAIEDGVLVKVFTHNIENFVYKYSNGKALVATAHLFNETIHQDLVDLWNKYLIWKQEVMPTLPEEEKLFSSMIKGKKVWVIEDEVTITMMYPEDY